METSLKLECTSNVSSECKTNFLTVADLIEHVFNIHYQYLCSTCLEYVAQTEEDHITHITQCDAPTNNNDEESGEITIPILQGEVRNEDDSTETTIPIFQDEMRNDDEDDSLVNEVNEVRKPKKSSESTKKKEKKKTNKSRKDNTDKKEISTRITRSKSQLDHNNINLVSTSHVTGLKRGRKPKNMKTGGNETKQKLFPCAIDDCTSEFSDLKRLYNHRCSMHPRNNFYVCKECNYVPYFNLASLKKHQSTSH